MWQMCDLYAKNLTFLWKSKFLHHQKWLLFCSISSLIFSNNIVKFGINLAKDFGWYQGVKTCVEQHDKRSQSVWKKNTKSNHITVYYSIYSNMVGPGFKSPLHFVFLDTEMISKLIYLGLLSSQQWPDSKISNILTEIVLLTFGSIQNKRVL